MTTGEPTQARHGLIRRGLGWLVRSWWVFLVALVVPIVVALWLVTEREIRSTGAPAEDPPRFLMGTLDPNLFHYVQRARGVVEIESPTDRRYRRKTFRRAFGLPWQFLFSDAVALHGGDSDRQLLKMRNEWSPAIRIHKQDGQRWIPSFIPLGIAWPYYGMNVATVFVLVELGLLGFLAARRTRRRRNGRCPGCAYDVKGLPTCPECGRKVA